MKRTIAVMFILLVGSGLVFSQTIRVIQPNGGEQLQKGTSYVIQWEATGTTNRFKITLWKDGRKVGPVGMKSAGNGMRNFPWTVGDFEDGTKADAGTGYTIKVREEDRPVSDVSDGTFEITSGLLGHFGTLISVKDLELKSVYYTWAMGGRIVARIKANLNGYKGDLAIKYKVLPGGREHTVTTSVDIARNAEKTISLMAKTPAEMGCTGVPLQVTLDPANAISETNEENNVLFKSVYAHSEHDGKLEYVKIKVGGAYVDVADGAEINFGNLEIANTDIMVRVLNCGGTRIENAELTVKQNYQSAMRDPEGFTPQRCRSFNDLMGSKANIALSPGIARTYTIPLRLAVKAPSRCRRTLNEVTVEFKCGESGPLNRNNILKFKIK